VTSKFKLGDKVVPDLDGYRDRRDWGKIIDITPRPNGRYWYKVGNSQGGSSYPWGDDELTLQTATNAVLYLGEGERRRPVGEIFVTEKRDGVMYVTGVVNDAHAVSVLSRGLVTGLSVNEEEVDE
jgi:hypothetical protein